jgi:hypothetical protein
MLFLFNMTVGEGGLMLLGGWIYLNRDWFDLFSEV